MHISGSAVGTPSGVEMVFWKVEPFIARRTNENHIATVTATPTIRRTPAPISTSVKG